MGRVRGMSSARLYERSWTHDRSHWGWYGEPTSTAFTRNLWDTPGPWHDEPDKVQWVDLATDYDALAKRNNSGAWCGYVGLPPGHPHHGADYDDVPVSVHGGLTYADLCAEGEDEAYGICHVPLPGRPDAVWWLGFDCSHWLDIGPRSPVYLDQSLRSDGFRAEYRTLAYVQDEVARLALQLAPRAIEAPRHD